MLNIKIKNMSNKSRGIGIVLSVIGLLIVLIVWQPVIVDTHLDDPCHYNTHGWQMDTIVMGDSALVTLHYYDQIYISYEK